MKPHLDAFEKDKSSRETKRDQELEEMEIKQAKFLLKRLRNEERNLKKSAFDREKKGFDEYMFEANSSQHRQDVKLEQDALKAVITHLSTQYKNQLNYRDPRL